MKSFLRLLGFLGKTERWRVDIDQQGPCGSVHYRELSGSLDCYWEFSGNDVVASIVIDTERDWNRRHPWAAGRRAEILQRIADEVIRQRAPNCRFEIDEVHGTIDILQRET